MTVTATLTLADAEPADGHLPGTLTVTVTDETSGEFAVQPADPLAGPYGAPYLMHSGPREPGTYVEQVTVHLLDSRPDAPAVVVVPFD